MKFQKAVVIMRGQPPHKSHLWLVRQALERAERVVVVLGSCYRPRTPKNPFSGAERRTMIELVLTPAERARMDFLFMRDYYDNRRWAEAVRKGVETPEVSGRSIALIGHEKDGSSYYLRLFQGWALQLVPRNGSIDATTIREAIYSGASPTAALAAISDLLDDPVREYLTAHLTRKEWGALRAEHAAYQAEARKWGPTPSPNYERFVLCADAVVQWENQVILIRRGPGVGHGLLAMPGGHVDPGETTYVASIRELREEVGTGLLEEEFDRSLVADAFLEAPTRSERPGRIVSKAYHFLIKSPKRPVIRQVSEEAGPVWMPIAELPALEDQFFEDHFMALDFFVHLT